MQTTDRHTSSGQGRAPKTTTPAAPLRGPRKSVAALATAILTVAAAVTMTSSPASAAAPTCNRYGAWDIANGGRINGPAYLPDSGALPYQWACTLRYGARGNPVLALQDNINDCYSSMLRYRIDSDSSFGNQTRNALIAIQRHHGIAADGVYGPQTARTIRHHGWIWTPYGYYWGCTTLP